MIGSISNSSATAFAGLNVQRGADIAGFTPAGSSATLGVTTPQDTITLSGQSPSTNAPSSKGAGTSSGPSILPSLPGDGSSSQDGTANGTSSPGSTSNGKSADGKDGAKTSGAQESQGTDASGLQKLTPDQQAEVAKLKQTDQHVRQHEAAHASAGGALAGSPTYDYTTGPDGQRYVIGGETPIRIPSVSASNPAQSIQELEQVVHAALAPSDPSSQDRAVASQAETEIAKAQSEETQKTLKSQDALNGGPSAQGSPSTQGGSSTQDGSSPGGTTQGGTSSPGADTAPPSLPAFGAPQSGDTASTAFGAGPLTAYRRAGADTPRAHGGNLNLQI